MMLVTGAGKQVKAVTYNDVSRDDCEGVRGLISLCAAVSWVY